MSETNSAAEAAAPHRYTAAMAADIEARWQDFWDAHGTYEAPNPTGDLADDPELAAKPKKFIMDMFPYPSGAGLHVGHPLGYIATDVFARHQRMTGHNVLHTLGFDAFGLPAEQYAVQTGTHPRASTEANMENMKSQLRRLGLGHDKRRSFATIEADYYKWTQWIFLQIFNSWYDTEADRARPIADLVAQFENGERPTPDGRDWSALSAVEHAEVLGQYRLAYASDAPVNWSPGLGTVLANEEVTADGRSERGNFPVFKAKLRQWNMRITAYADRLLNDLDGLDWPEAIKLQQRNWIGRSKARASTSRSTARGTSPSSPPARTPCSAPPTWCWRPSTTWWSGSFRPPGPRAPIRCGPADTRPRPRPSPPTASRPPPSPTWSGRPRPRTRPASSPARTRPTRSAAKRCPSSSPTTS